MASEWLDLIGKCWEPAKAFLNSSFFTSLTGSLAGAVGGAWGAQRLVERSKFKEESTAQIQRINGAIALAYGVFNDFASLKKQFAKPLKEKFERQLLESNRLEALLASGQKPSSQLVVELDFRTVTPLQSPVEALQEHIFNKLSLTGRPLNLSVAIAQTAHNLRVSIERRNALIEEYKERSLEQSEDLSIRYFGRPDRNGHTNRDYPDALMAICNLTDDGMFYSKRLCEDLTKEGNQIAGRMKDKLKEAPRVTSVIFSTAELSVLLPDESGYSDWNTNFVSGDNKK